MKYKFVKVSIALLFVTGLFCDVYAQDAVIKTNVPYWFTATPNVGFEHVLGEHLSLELTAGFNPFRFGETKQIKHWVVWPELRYWISQPLGGHFFGLHGVAGQYNIGGLDVPSDRFAGLQTRRYQGSAVGAGISYGYKWVLNDRWGLELTAGAGFARFNYEVYSLGKNGQKMGENKKNYFGLTKGALSFVYILR